MDRTGIIDIGSNSMRLSIMQEFANGGYYVLDEHKSSPRLFNEVGPSGELTARGIQELTVHLREFLSLCDAYEVNRVIALGTAALRAATNAQSVVAEVKDSLGLEIEIISGQEEARLGYSAVMHTLTVQDAYLVDIGGGSTEVTLVRQGRLVASYSFALGAVTMSRVKAPAGTAGLAVWRQLAIDAFSQQGFIELTPGIEVIGIGGTIRNIARVHQMAVGYPLSMTHNYAMTGAQVEETMRFLANMPLSRRKKIEGLSRERADLILPGGAILLALLSCTSSTRLRISGRGLRDGAFYTRRFSEFAGPPGSVLDTSVLHTLQWFGGTESHARHVTALAGQMFSAAVQVGLLPPQAVNILYAAAMLHRVGVNVNYYHYDRHTFYLIMSSSIYGLTHREILLAAAAASYKSRQKMRKLCSPYLSLCQDGDMDLAARIGVLIRLAETLDRRHSGRIPSVSLRLVDNRFELWLPPGSEAQVEISATMALASHVKKVYGRNLEVCM
ncbi:MAG: Ppx/GppA phosphatase family protein [Firmicutes bacterium]|nr:Ppx/GppA phosphatase family protein [Bacillota bacterium]